LVGASCDRPGLDRAGAGDPGHRLDRARPGRHHRRGLHHPRAALAFSPAYTGKTSGEHVLAGIAGVIAGIVLVAWPGPTLLVLAFFVGAWLTVSGGFHIITSFSRRRALPHWGFTFAVGVIEVLLGIWSMRRPEATLALLITIIGLWAIVTGVIYCVLAFEIRSAPREPAPSTDGTKRKAA
jgi:uncharacterized membrane protein HdeD (DUF308 family)